MLSIDKSAAIGRDFRKIGVAGISILAFCAASYVFCAVAATPAVPGTRVLGLKEICDNCTVEVFSSECKDILEAPNFDKEGTLWVAAPRLGMLNRVTPDGHCIPAVKVPGQWPTPAGLRFDKNGTLYGVDVRQGLFSVDVKTLEARLITNSYSIGGGGAGNFHGLDDLVFDAAGGAYITDQMGSSALDPDGRIFYRAADGKMTLVASGNLAHPDGIALSPDGRTLYVSEWLGNRILSMPVVAPGVVNIDMAQVFAYVGGAQPDGMAVDTAGNLYVAEWGAGGQIGVFAADGSFYGAIVAPAGTAFRPTNLAFHAGYLYATDARGLIWRVRTKVRGNPLYGS